MGKKTPSPQVKGNGKDVKLKYMDSSNTGLQISTCFFPNQTAKLWVRVLEMLR